MLFRLVNINADSRIVTFVFCNDGTFQLFVKTYNGNMFIPYALYDIKVSHNLPLEYLLVDTSYNYSNIGVVTRKTKKSVHIASGSTHWTFPRIACSLNPGMDVWISVVLVAEKEENKT